MSPFIPAGLANAARALRDRAFEELANRSPLRRYGEIHDFRLDPRSGEIRLSLLLKGEPAAVAVRAFCHLERTVRGDALVIDRLSTSREWANILFADLTETRPAQIALSPKLALAARILGLKEGNDFLTQGHEDAKKKQGKTERNLRHPVTAR